jgi:hypothetical protein
MGFLQVHRTERLPFDVCVVGQRRGDCGVAFRLRKLRVFGALITSYNDSRWGDRFPFVGGCLWLPHRGKCGLDFRGIYNRARALCQQEVGRRADNH